MKFVYSDGGRSKYFKGKAGDCVVRAICNATGFDYKEVYDNVKDLLQHTPRNGLLRKETRDIMNYYGFEWKPFMQIGTGTRYHLTEEDLPNEGTYVLKLSHHLTVIKDGVIYDTFNPSRGGTRCVYGFWKLWEED